MPPAWIADGNCDPGIPRFSNQFGGRTDVPVRVLRKNSRPAVRIVDVQEDVRAEVRLRTMAQK